MSKTPILSWRASQCLAGLRVRGLLAADGALVLSVAGLAPSTVGSTSCAATAVHCGIEGLLTQLLGGVLLGLGLAAHRARGRLSAGGVQEVCKGQAQGVRRGRADWCQQRGRARCYRARSAAAGL